MGEDVEAPDACYLVLQREKWVLIVRVLDLALMLGGMANNSLLGGNEAVPVGTAAADNAWSALVETPGVLDAGIRRAVLDEVLESLHS